MENRTRARTRGQRATSGCAGYAIVPEQHRGGAARCAQLRYRALPGTRPRDRNVVVVNDVKGSFTNGHPIVRSGRGGLRPLASAIRDGSSGSEGGRRSPEQRGHTLSGLLE